MEREFDKSYCKNGWLHRYNLVSQHPECFMEVCAICSDTQYYPVVNGRTDNYAYLSRNLRQVLPRVHPLFPHEYPLYGQI